MRYIIILQFAVLFIATETNAKAESGYSCRNTDFEISCTSQRCEVTLDESFTPMGVNVSNGRMEVCAYSGCWSGVPKLFFEDASNVVAQGDLSWRDTNEDSTERMNIVIDIEIGVGFFMGAGFFHPMQCRPWV